MKTAFQLSGGKDSTAAFYTVLDSWPTLDVYVIDTGDMFPEQRKFLELLESDFGRSFKWVKSDVHAIIRRHGPPADVIPFNASAPAHDLGLQLAPPLQNRGDCCFRAKMLPMHARMLDDKIECIIRGQRAEDEYKGPLRNGAVAGPFKMLYPIEHWTRKQVMDYLLDIDRVPPLYEHGIVRSGDCITCSAWLGDARPAYVLREHPTQGVVLKSRINAIRAAVEIDLRHLARSEIEMEIARI